EYATRHRRLHQALVDAKSDCLLMEGGATMQYYTNIQWDLTERPFLVVLFVDNTLPTGINMTVITPEFELTKAQKRLAEAKLPDDIQPTLVSWKEHESPFEGLRAVLPSETRVLIEPATRLFIYDGLRRLFPTDMAPIGIQQLRMIKSPAELSILRCANTVTEMAIRAVRPHVKVGMSEYDIQQLMTSALKKAGLTNTWVLALVDEHAALPHGDSSETKVKKDSVVLIDTGGELYGYQSDTTRTFFLGKKDFNETIKDAWYLVKQAQESVLDHTIAGNTTAAQVDLAARHVIQKGGYGPYFTHRLGHGIGLEMHEEPYMNKGNTELVLVPGMTFSVEPGIYITNEFGIRLEDIAVVSD
ncbi:Creatinase/aminopeptidase, partial [Rhizopus microsporus ATCC 52813]